MARLKKKRKNQSKYNEHFERIDASPELVAEVIMKTSPKKKDEWHYLEKLKN